MERPHGMVKRARTSRWMGDEDEDEDDGGNGVPPDDSGLVIDC